MTEHFFANWRCTTWNAAARRWPWSSTGPRDWRS